MPALYSHTTRATGTTLTAAIYNSDHQNHIDNGVPAQIDDYSASAGQMQSTADPGEVGTESLATSLAGELERLRFAIAELKTAVGAAGGAKWYSTLSAATIAAAVNGNLYTAKGDVLVASAAATAVKKAAPANGLSFVADSSQSDGWAAQKTYPRNYAPNPFFQIDQRVNSGTSVADDVYSLDRWINLNQSNPVTVTQQTAQEDGQPFNIRITQANASAQRFGLLTILEGKDAKILRGKQVTFRPRVRISNSQAVRVAILEWTGTEDSVTSDVVNDWTSGTYTGNNFFVAANYTISAVGAKTPSANTWTDMDALTVTLGSTFNNLVLFVWVEQTAAQNVTLDIGKVRFVEGSYAEEVEYPQFSEELWRCQRYFEKSFLYSVAPAQNVGSESGAVTWQGFRAGTVLQYAGRHHFANHKRIVPTMTFYNPRAADSQVRNITQNQNTSATGSNAIGEENFEVFCTGSASSAIADIYAVHWTANAEL